MSAVERALAEFGIRAARIQRIPVGLLHESFAVRAGDVEYVAQRVSPVFDPAIHENIRAVTEHLRAKGVEAPRLVETRAGALCADLGPEGRWRLLTRVRGVGFDVCESPAQARAAGRLIARFHTALDDLPHRFRPLGFPYHESALHRAELEAAVAEHARHPLYDAVAPLAEAILRADAEELPATLPARVIHDDLKFNNVLFAGACGAARAEAVALIDLDTVTRAPLWRELGDAWRSWCNRRGEDSEQAELDPALLAAAVEGYLGALGIELGADERASLAFGLEAMSLQLAARFATDALRECYFGWDPARFDSRGQHNLVRARGQLSLYAQARASRGERLRLLGARGS